MNHHPRPEHFGHLLLALVADTEEKAIELGRQCMWTENHRARGPREHNAPRLPVARGPEGEDEPSDDWHRHVWAENEL